MSEMTFAEAEGRRNACIRNRSRPGLLAAGPLAVCLVASACGVGSSTPPEWQFLGQKQVDFGAIWDGTTIGGLSGVSYEPGSDTYYIVSDDRSARNPARFYTASIPLSVNGIHDVQFLSSQPWRDPNGAVFPPLNTEVEPVSIPPDAEGIAVDAGRQRLYWSSEGERLVDEPGAPVLQDPSVHIADLDGRHVGTFALPENLRTEAGERGPRQNLGFEGLTLSPGGRWLWAAMEGPLFQDGPPPSPSDGALVRITKLDPESRNALAQYVYPLDPVTAGPDGDNGLSDLVALNDSSFLVVERGFDQRNAVRIYRAELAEADDVLKRPETDPHSVRTMTKTLMVDLTESGDLARLDNIEGITLGPVLADGRQSVVLVSDDNFSQNQVTQIVAFAMPRPQMPHGRAGR